jgi:hypothetical protein
LRFDAPQKDQMRGGAARRRRHCDKTQARHGRSGALTYEDFNNAVTGV